MVDVEDETLLIDELVVDEGAAAMIELAETIAWRTLVSIQSVFVATYPANELAKT